MISIQALTAKMAFNNGKIVKNTGDSISKVQRKTKFKECSKIREDIPKIRATPPDDCPRSEVQDYAILTLL